MLAVGEEDDHETSQGLGTKADHSALLVATSDVLDKGHERLFGPVLQISPLQWDHIKTSVQNMWMALEVQIRAEIPRLKEAQAREMGESQRRRVNEYMRARQHPWPMSEDGYAISGWQANGHDDHYTTTYQHSRTHDDGGAIPFDAKIERAIRESNARRSSLLSAHFILSEEVGLGVIACTFELLSSYHKIRGGLPVAKALERLMFVSFAVAMSAFFGYDEDPNIIYDFMKSYRAMVFPSANEFLAMQIALLEVTGWGPCVEAMTQWHLMPSPAPPPPPPPAPMDPSDTDEPSLSDRGHEDLAVEAYLLDSMEAGEGHDPLVFSEVDRQVPHGGGRVEGLGASLAINRPF